jgi:hypothetical protein
MTALLPDIRREQITLARRDLSVQPSCPHAPAPCAYIVLPTWCHWGADCAPEKAFANKKGFANKKHRDFVGGFHASNEEGVL